MLTVWIIVGVVFLAIILMYNSLIGKKNEVENIFGGLDAVLKKRYDLIPNLVAAVSQYMEHERGLLERITELRAQALQPDIDDARLMELDGKIASTLGAIMVAVENYPELKASENILHLQRTLHEVEAQISAARRAYNQAVTDLNNAIEMIPTNIMAGMMHLERKPVFEISDTERENVDVDALFQRALRPS